MKILTAILIITQIAGVANAELIAHWKFDDASANIATDSTGNSNIGSLHGEPVWGPGLIDGALEFDGRDDYVELPIGSIIGSLTNSTFAVWVNFSGTGNPWQRIFDFGSGTTENIFLTPRDINNRIRFAITTGGLDTEQQVTTLTTLSSGWHHIVVTIDADKNIIALYLDTRLIAENAAATVSPRNLGNTTQNWLGRSQYSADAYFKGSLDDFRIYNHAMNTDEVTVLYCRSFFPSSEILSQTIKEAEAIIKNQNPEQAIIFIEKKITEYKEQIQDDHSGLTQKVLSSELYFTLAEIEKTAGVPKEHVVSAYKRAAESGGLFPPKLGSALLWLYENVDSKEYEQVVQSLIANNSRCLKEAATKAGRMINERKFQAAIGFLEANLNPYLRRQESDVFSEPAIPRIYFLLARAKEATGAPKKEIADTYNLILKPSQSYHAPEWNDALIWLMENGCENECATAIGTFTQDFFIENCFKNTIAQICRYFEKENNIAKFNWFLDTLFTEAAYPCEWALFVQSSLAGTTLANNYSNYLNSNYRLKFGMDCIIADKLTAEKKYNQAAELYKNIVGRCGQEDDKPVFELKLCKCLFEAGQYQDVIRLSDNFISSYKATHRNLVKETMLIKGRSYIQLADIEKAIEPLLTYLIEYPDSKQAPEANFILGYCYMLLGKFEEATAAFNLLIGDYPESSYVTQAQSYRQRIKNMTE